MKIERLDHREKEDFITYCIKHRNDVDDSFLYDKDLADFEPDEENPTFVVREKGRVVAAASLILNGYHRRGRNGRFRIFHSETQDSDAYSLLLTEILKHSAGLDKVFLFVPFTNKALAGNMERLGFAIERYAFLLIKELGDSPPVELPDGYSIRAFQPDNDEDAWCRIRNTAFSSLKGNSTPITPDMVQKFLSQPDYLEGGLMLLLHADKPVGIIRGAYDDYEGTPAMNIGPVAILPAYQGKGLGTQLLRMALEFARLKNYKKTTLSVNAENESAKALYMKEGFVQAEGVAEYAYCLC